MDGRGTLCLSADLETVPGDQAAHPAGLGPGRYIRLSVSDTGVGMTPEVLARASEPFFTTKGVNQGTGLGLAMTRGFSEQSGGGLHIASEPGRGTVVSLWLPVSPEQPAASPTVEHPASGHPAGRPRARLLMVDDEPNVRETLSQQMQDEGFAVLVAETGQQALDTLQDGERVDLVIADLSMPGMDGLTLVQEIHRRHPALPAILLTGFATSAAEMALSSAVNGRLSLLRKPIEGTVLAERATVMIESTKAN
jgi:CheY-like chemotaxis protein